MGTHLGAPCRVITTYGTFETWNNCVFLYTNLLQRGAAMYRTILQTVRNIQLFTNDITDHHKTERPFKTKRKWKYRLSFYISSRWKTACTTFAHGNDVCRYLYNFWHAITYTISNEGSCDWNLAYRTLIGIFTLWEEVTPSFFSPFWTQV